MNLQDRQATELVIGYDAREYWLALDQFWPVQRKESFLYRLDIFKPLSIDTRVWPSIFASEHRPVPVERSGFQDSWTSFFALRTAVTNAYQQQIMRPWRMVAITLLLGPYCEREAALWKPHLFPATPSQRGEGWTFLGYDVGDQWMLSALSNCGFLPELDDVPALRATWGIRLNEFHLFQDFADAVQFKYFSDQRLREDHAPCFVYGLWFVK